jgi:hypothetical protein
MLLALQKFTEGMRMIFATKQKSHFELSPLKGAMYGSVTKNAFERRQKPFTSRSPALMVHALQSS